MIRSKFIDFLFELLSGARKLFVDLFELLDLVVDLGLLPKVNELIKKLVAAKENQNAFWYYLHSVKQEITDLSHLVRIFSGLKGEINLAVSYPKNSLAEYLFLNLNHMGALVDIFKMDADLLRKIFDGGKSARCYHNRVRVFLLYLSKGKIGIVAPQVKSYLSVDHLHMNREEFEVRFLQQFFLAMVRLPYWNQKIKEVAKVIKDRQI